MTVVGMIPARFASSRFPGKPLARISGRPMIAWVVERALAARCLDRVIVATDHEEIASAAELAGATAVLTDPALPSGTDRIATVARSIDCEWVINIQGDEPLIPPENIELLADHLTANPRIKMATLRAPICDERDRANPNVVKVVTDLAGRALYFGRSPLPYFRNPGVAWKHLGLYGYRRDFLLEFSEWHQTPLEQTEGLEQLRALESGVPIVVLDVVRSSPAVDTPEDLEEIERILLGPAGRTDRTASIGVGA